MYLQSEAKCPYCSTSLAKPPSRKAKCSNCQETYFVRTRPDDRARVICTLSEAQAIDEALQKPYRRYGVDRPPVDLSRDQRWASFCRQRQQHFQTLSFGLARNTTLEMSQYLFDAGHPRLGLLMTLEVCYIDVNGCWNGSLMNGKLSAVGYPWRLGVGAHTAPGVVQMVRDAVEELEIDQETLGLLLLAHLNACRFPVLAPYTPEQAMPTLMRIAYGDENGSKIAVCDVTPTNPPPSIPTLEDVTDELVAQLSEGTTANRTRHSTTRVSRKSGCLTVLAIVPIAILLLAFL